MKLNRAIRRALEKQGRTVKMEEQKKRTMEEIQTEYNQTAARLGGLSYQAELLKGEINSLLQRMSDLNKEANEAKNASQE